MKHLVFALIMTFALAVDGQNISSRVELIYSHLNYDQSLSDALIATSTAVLVNTPSATMTKSDWKQSCNELHTFLAKLKIDAVVYIYFGDFLAGREATPSFVQYLIDRDIKNLVFYDYALSDNNTNHTIRVTSFNGSETLVEPGQSAWRKSSNVLKDAATALGNDIIRNELKPANFLISDTPEFLEDVKVLQKRKFPVYTTDVRIEKLAVPYFDSVKVQNKNTYSADILNAIDAYNNKVAKANKELEVIMSSYPYKYDFVKYSDESRYYFMNGFQFILVNVHARGSVLKNLLDYEKTNNLTHLVTVTNGDNPVTKKIPIEIPVFKFYIRHSISGNVYVGDFWDAATTWQEALRIFINNVAYNAKQ